VTTYRVTTSADLPDGERDEVFDIAGDDFHISTRGGVRVVEWYRDAPPGLLAKLGTIFRPARRNVAWVPHDSLVSIRALPEGPPPDAVRLPVDTPPVPDQRLMPRPSDLKPRA
jgi:hypothetical protein